MTAAGAAMKQLWYLDAVLFHPSCGFNSKG